MQNLYSSLTSPWWNTKLLSSPRDSSIGTHMTFCRSMNGTNCIPSYSPRCLGRLVVLYTQRSWALAWLNETVLAIKAIRSGKHSNLNSEKTKKQEAISSAYSHEKNELCCKQAQKDSALWTDEDFEYC